MGEGKRGGAPFPKPIRPPPLWGAHQPLVGWLASLLWPALSSPIRPMWPINFPGEGGPVTSRYSKTYLKLPETILVFECNIPIYESLPLDHFETPRHVRDLIQDSKQTSVTKTHNS